MTLLIWTCICVTVFVVGVFVGFRLGLVHAVKSFVAALEDLEKTGKISVSTELQPEQLAEAVVRHLLISKRRRN